MFEDKLKKNDLNKVFSFNDYFSELKVLSPIKNTSKISLSYEFSDEEIYNNSKECIMRNLMNNSNFRKETHFSLEMICKFYDFMKKKTYSPDLLAESLILLHSSKCNGSWHIFRAFFEGFNIKLVGREDCEFYDKLKTLSTILESVKQFLDIRDSSRFKWCSNEEKEVVFILEFIRLMFHETVHVVLRSNTNDLNSSSPLIEKKISQRPLAAEIDLLELGLKTEVKVFHGLLNLLDSLESRILNIPVCSKFLEDFLANKPVVFSIQESGCKTFKEEDFLKMALDYRPNKLQLYA
ncbi:hypothetical protein BpHYR1_048295 [Brachionus plicatilis]|uniref:Uncharacterized protein n=1 Tax=Brachionus plicatilis TaxID=10195 RepID=A0A3M7RWD0_BRAPC|nr:hypothetical protein BpHYR1_048295 [Brachionus plicatilis]